MHARGMMTIHGVLGYKSAIYSKYCHLALPLYNDSIDLNELAKELFLPNEVWASRNDHLFKVVRKIWHPFMGFIIPKEGEGDNLLQQGREVQWDIL